MEYYTFNKEALIYTKVNKVSMVLKVLAPLSIIFLLGMISAPDKTEVERISEEAKLIVITEASKFSEQKLVEEITRLNFRFPHIVLAQAQIESGHFGSPIFIENHNMFGMKEARVRANLARGTKRNHAYYDTWKESLYDYAFYYSEYLSNLRTEDNYYSYLSQSYAEDPNYVATVRKQANKNKSLFN